jgi:hypothetical protein
MMKGVYGLVAFHDILAPSSYHPTSNLRYDLVSAALCTPLSSAGSFHNVRGEGLLARIVSAMAMEGERAISQTIL